nr:SGNH hydrolase domain-containing protein [Zhihengliuella flava]
MGQAEVTACHLGVEPRAAEQTWALVGDSHATAWLPALDAIARERKIALEVYTRGGCTPNVAERVTQTTGRDLRVVRTCDSSNREVSERIAQSSRIDAVLVAASQIDREWVNADGQDFANPSVEGMTSMWHRWMDSGKDVMVFGEVPRLEQDETDVPTCVAEHRDNVVACSVAVQDAFPWNDNLRRASESVTDERFHFLETKDLFCREDTCHAVIGGVVTYYDGSHVSETYARELAPEIARRFEAFGVLSQG